MTNTKEIKIGQCFKYDGEEWMCTSNDEFIFTASNLNENSTHADFMLVGMSEDVEIIK